MSVYNQKPVFARLSDRNRAILLFFLNIYVLPNRDFLSSKTLDVENIIVLCYQMLSINHPPSYSIRKPIWIPFRLLKLYMITLLFQYRYVYKCIDVKCLRIVS